MVFGLNCEALIGGIQRRTLWNGPGLQHAVQFEAKVVVQAGGVVALHDEGILAFGGSAASWLRTLSGRPLALIFLQRIHAASIFLSRRLLPSTSAMIATSCTEIKVFPYRHPLM